MEKGEDTNAWMQLPEDCIAEILALTSPPDVCRLSLVCRSVESAAKSDSVWEKFLPSDYQSIIAGSVLSPPHDFPSKKDIFVYLSHNPLLIDGARKSFSVDKWTGKKRYFLSARDLNSAWGDGTEYWNWTSLPESRFPEVVRLDYVWWFEIWGTIRAGILSPRTSYTAYFVYKLENEFGFDCRPLEVSIGISGIESSQNRLVILQPDGSCQHHDNNDDHDDDDGDNDNDNDDDDKESPYACLPLPKLRDDGWFEVELGEFSSENGDDCIEMRMKEVNAFTMGGLIVEGIELRPRMG